MEVLRRLTTTQAVLPAPAGRPAVGQETLLATFRQLKTQDFPALAATLHDQIGKADVLAYQRFLMDEILIKGSWMLVEHLVRHAGEQRTAEADSEFTGQLRDHIAGSVSKGLVRKVGFQMTAEVGRQRDALIAGAIEFLDDLLTAAPPGRLLLPRLGSPFDPERHEPIPGCPEAGERKITATLFPGCVVFEEGEQRVREKALVYIEPVG